jgi:L-ribulokinase
MKRRYAIGLDYGTNSCRSLLVDLNDGREVAQYVFNYPSGTLGVVTDPKDAHVARQHPQDYLEGLEATLTGALRAAAEADPQFSAADVVGIGVDSTGSTVIPVDRQAVPLALHSAFADRPAALTWLWKDHTAHAEAAAITALAARTRPQYLGKCGGVYSSEWFWAKVWRCKKVDPDVFAAAHSWVELCDYLPAVLTGVSRSEDVKRSVCAAGHKAMFNPEWGGLPDKKFLTELDPALAELRDRLYDEAHPADHRAGGLSEEWARKTGLRAGIAVAVGAFDAHIGAVGAGVREGTLVKVLGTSTCDILVSPEQKPLQDIPGVCGIVNGSVLNGFHGIEAGQSAVGDIFLWFVHQLAPDRYGATPEARYAALGAAASALSPGESGLLALDWNNGNRTILVDQRLTGLLLGQTLNTEAHEIYRALIEATAFGALRIIERVEEYGVPIREIVACGGLAEKNALLMQIYADVSGRPHRVAGSPQTCALGAALLSAVAAGAANGGFDTVADAQAVLCRLSDTVYTPDARAHATYRRLYALYRQLHDAFGVAETAPDARLYNVMKELLTLREEAHAAQEN